MITKYDMASGERMYQSAKREVETLISVPYELTGPTPAIQLVTIESQPEPEKIPPDLATVSVTEFLNIIW